MSGCGVTSPSNNASITNGTAGAGVMVGVSEASGVAVIANAVTACVAVLKGASVSVAVGIVGVDDWIWKTGTAGSSICTGLAKIASTMPARMEMPRNENARLARVVFCSRLRKLIERLDSWRARMPMT